MKHEWENPLSMDVLNNQSHARDEFHLGHGDQRHGLCSGQTARPAESTDNERVVRFVGVDDSYLCN